MLNPRVLPIAWYLSQEYLAGFSERVILNWWDYSLPVVIFMTIIFSTIAAVLRKSARSNPIEALRCERTCVKIVALDPK